MDDGTESRRLLDAVWQGTLSPQEAEDRAAGLGIAPLTAEPEFDIGEIALWTLPMAIAWILWREMRDVAFEHPDHAGGRRVWRIDNQPNAPRRYYIGPPDPPSVKRLFTHDAELTTGHPSTDQRAVYAALAQLWAELSAGRIEGAGLDRHLGGARSIGRDEWSGLRYTASTGYGDRLYYSSNRGRPGIDEVVFPGAEVVAAFPELPVGQHVRPLSVQPIREGRGPSVQQVAIRRALAALNLDLEATSQKVVVDLVREWVAAQSGMNGVRPSKRTIERFLRQKPE
jgi:hypothetical protein